MPTNPFPLDTSQLTADRLTELVQTVDPDTIVESFRITDSKEHGDGSGEVSTANRLELDMWVNGPSGQRRERVVIKSTRPDLASIPLYRNEVEFYTRVYPELDIEVPRPLGGEFDEFSGTFGLALENLRERGAVFPNVKTNVTQAHIRSLLDTLATLHARFWQSEELGTTLDFVEPHTHGSVSRFFHSREAVPALVRAEIDNEQFKRELVEGLGQTELGLYREFRKLQFHQAVLPITLCHGDCHIGNTYWLPEGRAGLLDWQMMAKGYFMHDVAYILITSLSVAQRRAYQGELLAYYLQRLNKHGVNQIPDMATTWLEYRRAAVWCLYIGWLTTPIENYGWDINVCNHVRLATAYRDLDTSSALAELPEPPPPPV